MGLASQLRVLEDKRQDIFELSRNIPTLEKQQRELQQQVTIAENNYLKLLERRQESLLAENQVLGSAAIIEQAQIPQIPVDSIFDSKSKKYILAGTAASLLLGITTAFFLDLADRSIKTVKDGEALLGYPLLGLIPRFIDRSSPIITLRKNQTAEATACQRLYVNLKLINVHPCRRAVTITSSVAQEGKSEVCANLAAIMAQAGQRTLLVDANLRSPSQHHLWNVSNQVGLSDVVLGKEDLSGALQSLDDNLTLLTAGVSVPNPLTVLDSKLMEELIQSLLGQYDYVLFDTPSLAKVADAAMLGKLSDGVLLVLQPRKADSSSALSAKSLLEKSGAYVLGIVANNVNIQEEHKEYVHNLQ